MSIKIKLPIGVETTSKSNRDGNKDLLLTFKDDENLIEFVRRLLDVYNGVTRRIENPLPLFETMDSLINILRNNRYAIAKWKNTIHEVNNMKDILKRLGEIISELITDLS